jgi:dTDP-4-amino-4,6-dideoxygalactose transaminase
MGSLQIKLPLLVTDSTCVWHQYVIKCNERDRLIEYLNEKGIGTIIHYPVPPHLQECYKNLGYKKGDFPITEELAKTVLSIPMYNGMTKEEQDYVIEAINAFK